MRGLRQWMSDHSEIAGFLVFLLIVVVISGISYGISYATGRGSGRTGQVQESRTEETTEETSEHADESSSAESQAERESSSATQTEPVSSEASGNESSSAASGNGTASEPSVGDTVNEYGVYFQIVDESVTAKIETNLRRVPSTENDADVVATIYNGEWIRRTGIGHNGWSRVEYNGQVLYAVTSYLSTDGSSSSEPTYQETSDSVTAKEEVYLRQTPDSSNDSNIVATLPRGQFVTRTGIGSNGWSRLDYNGTVVYAVTSLLTTEQ